MPEVRDAAAMDELDERIVTTADQKLSRPEFDDGLREDRARVPFDDAVLDGLEEADRGSSFTHDEVMRGLEARFGRR